MWCRYSVFRDGIGGGYGDEMEVWVWQQWMVHSPADPQSVLKLLVGLVGNTLLLHNAALSLFPRFTPGLPTKLTMSD